MVDILNGVPDRDVKPGNLFERIEDWLLVQSNGVALAGASPELSLLLTDQHADLVIRQLRERAWLMRPAYMLADLMGLMNGPDGSPLIQRRGFTVVSPFGYNSIEELWIPPGAIIVPVRAMSAPERAHLAKSIERIQLDLAKARSGLLLPQTPGLGG